MLATDIAPTSSSTPPTASAAGLGNVETREMDGETLEVEPETYDAVISRVGLIYFPDQLAAVASSEHRQMGPAADLRGAQRAIEGTCGGAGAERRSVASTHTSPETGCSV